MTIGEELAGISTTCEAAAVLGPGKSQERFDDPSEAEAEAAAALGSQVKLLRALITGDLKRKEYFQHMVRTAAL
jgi:hypothetical protein